MKRATPAPFEVDFAGLYFKGTAIYTPGDPGKCFGPPEKCYPPEPAEVEIHTLTCGSYDAMFLMDGDMAESIEDLVVDYYEEVVIAEDEEQLIGDEDIITNYEKQKDGN